MILITWLASFSFTHWPAVKWYSFAILDGVTREGFHLSAEKVVTFLVLSFSKNEIDLPSSWCRLVSRKDNLLLVIPWNKLLNVQCFVVNQFPLCHIIILPCLPNYTRLDLLWPLSAPISCRGKQHWKYLVSLLLQTLHY